MAEGPRKIDNFSAFTKKAASKSPIPAKARPLSKTSELAGGESEPSLSQVLSVLGILRAGPMAPPDILKELGIPSLELRQLLATLEAEGAIELDDEYRYRITESK